MARFQHAMLIPRVADLAEIGRARQTGELDEAHAALNEPARQQALPRVFRLLPHRRIQSVELLRGLALAAEID